MNTQTTQMHIAPPFSLFSLLSPLSHSSCPIRVYAYRPLLSFHPPHFPYSLSLCSIRHWNLSVPTWLEAAGLYTDTCSNSSFLRWLFTDPGAVHANRPPILDQACISTFLLKNGINQFYLNHPYSKGLVALSLKPLHSSMWFFKVAIISPFPHHFFIG